MMNRRSVLTQGFTLGIVAASAGVRPGPALAGSPDFFATNGTAIHGYDPVAYFTDAGPVEGTSAIALMWGGAVWRFSTEANRTAFEMNPRKYAPQYGGYCAYAMSKGAIATTVPEAWTVHRGKLYLNFSSGVRNIWTKDIPGNVAAADANWPAALKA